VRSVRRPRQVSAAGSGSETPGRSHEQVLEKLIFDRTFGVIKPKCEPGAKLAGVAKSPASAFYEDTDDERPEDHQRKGGSAGARQATWQCEPGLQDARL
jgi:hypothetical protein